MDDESIKLIVEEIAPLLTGRAAGKIFQLGPTSLAIDFGLRETGYLFINVEAAAPGIYFIKRRVRDLEKQSTQLASFALALRKELASTRLAQLEKITNDRVVRFTFTGEDDLGKRKERTLVAQLTGRSANLLLLDDRRIILQGMRNLPKGGMSIGDLYQPSTSQPLATKKPAVLARLLHDSHGSRSETADRYFAALSAGQEKTARIASARAELRRQISQQERLLKQLETDHRRHENPEEHKRIGDLLLANLSTAKRAGNIVSLIDYFAAEAPTLNVEVDVSISLQEAAARRFELYAKSKRALEQINRRMQTVRLRLRELEAEQHSLEQRIAAGQFPSPASEQPSSMAVRRQNASVAARKAVRGARQYLSSDGFEILVGRTANDNDQLTFKIARPNDLWLHAADYGGSHVVVRNSTRKDIPHRTLIEAAQLAAYFSQARKNSRADVHYTERKFVSKIKAAKPGLVRLQRFKNVTVEPKESVNRL